MSYKPLFCHNCTGDLREVDGGWECKVCGHFIDTDGRHYLSRMRQPMTNADRIRSMSNEELAAFLEHNTAGCYCCAMTCIGCDPEDLPNKSKCQQNVLTWLQQPAEQTPPATMATEEKLLSGLIEED